MLARARSKLGPRVDLMCGSILEIPCEDESFDGVICNQVIHLEGRSLSELLLAGLSCSFILSSGIVKDVGRFWMGAGVPDVWMPAVTGLCFFPLYILSVWLLNQLPEPSPADVES